MCTVKHRNSPQTLVSNQSQAALGSGPDVAWALSYPSAKGSCELGTKAVLESHTPHRCAPQKSSIHCMLDYELTSGHWSFRSLWPLPNVCNSRTPFCRDHSPWFKKLEIKALNYNHLVLTKEIKHTLCIYNLFIKWCWEDFVHKEENETRALSLTQCEKSVKHGSRIFIIRPESVRGNTPGYGYRYRLSGKSSNSSGNITWIDKCDYIKWKFPRQKKKQLSEDTVLILKKKIFGSYTYNRGLISRLLKELKKKNLSNTPKTP